MGGGKTRFYVYIVYAIFHEKVNFSYNSPALKKWVLQIKYAYYL